MDVAVDMDVVVEIDVVETTIVDYESMDQVSALAKDKPTVLFFKASWCPSCISAAKNFESKVDELKDINLVVVNYDESKELQKLYGVTYQHTFVQVNENEEALAKWNGGSTKKLLNNIVKGDM